MESFDRLANPNLGRGDADHCEQRGPQAHERQKKPRVSRGSIAGQIGALGLGGKNQARHNSSA
jgi:hypothetical protein